MESGNQTPGNILEIIIKNQSGLFECIKVLDGKIDRMEKQNSEILAKLTNMDIKLSQHIEVERNAAQNMTSALQAVINQ